MKNIMKSSRRKKTSFSGHVNNILTVMGIILDLIIIAYASVYIYIIINDISIEGVITPISVIEACFNIKQIAVIFVLVVILINVIVTGYYLITGKLYVRKLTDDEYDKLMDIQLIHYTNYIEGNSETGYIIQGNDSARANYSMKFNMAKGYFIWFHKSKNYTCEPEMKSFNFSHSAEKKRKYKIIINPRELERDRLFIRGIDNSIVYKDQELCVKNIEEDFVWYSNKVKIGNFFCQLDFQTIGVIIWALIKQVGGEFIDWRTKNSKR
ncbi:hypothetical protein [Cellulosilyticum sp. WCF-2]|uniref:hypothetical protein n=1 Tax=Cellulosilyticum sp. WCF-2 TaxID=2497860 RepID=UPI000F8C617E|nr:hypothetical protein [Cellulosilyticum sp. WCF-2]QEH68628.1 hypothetical protein EKH84_09685 [Cellulosilyticum sp. WCF-2]